MHEAHRRDALAIVKFLHWLTNNWVNNDVAEISASDQLEIFRREDRECLDLSFDTINGFADNGAIVHYRSSEKTNRQIDDSNIYLVDSGGQYLCGTTDITRTIHLGNPSPEQKYHYTLVVFKGHLALRHTIFPPWNLRRTFRRISSASLVASRLELWTWDGSWRQLLSMCS